VPKPGVPEPLSGDGAVLVIGAHREELAFGERVAAELAAAPIDVYRIPNGISGRRPRQDQTLRYRAYHKELYLQLKQTLKGRYALLLDLHAGIDSNGPCADLMSGDERLLQRSGAALPDGPAGERTRLIPFRTSAEHPAAQPLARPIVPATLWQGSRPRYLALEVYLREPGPGDPQAWRLAREIILAVLAAAARRPTCDTLNH